MDKWVHENWTVHTSQFKSSLKIYKNQESMVPALEDQQRNLRLRNKPSFLQGVKTNSIVFSTRVYRQLDTHTPEHERDPPNPGYSSSGWLKIWVQNCKTNIRQKHQRKSPRLCTWRLCCTWHKSMTKGKWQIGFTNIKDFIFWSNSQNGIIFTHHIANKWPIFLTWKELLKFKRRRLSS